MSSRLKEFSKPVENTKGSGKHEIAVNSAGGELPMGGRIVARDLLVRIGNKEYMLEVGTPEHISSLKSEPESDFTSEEEQRLWVMDDVNDLEQVVETLQSTPKDVLLPYLVEQGDDLQEGAQKKSPFPFGNSFLGNKLMPYFNSIKKYPGDKNTFKRFEHFYTKVVDKRVKKGEQTRQRTKR